MTEHSLELVRSEAVRHPDGPKHPLDRLDPKRMGQHLTIFRPPASTIPALVAKAQTYIPGITAADVVNRVAAHNADCLWGIARTRRHDPANPEAEGFVALLPLTMLGLKQLAVKALDTSNPDLSVVTRPGERPAGIYVWAMYAPGLLVGGVPLVLEEFSKPPYEGVDLYSRPNTEDGVRFNLSCGYKRGAKVGAIFARHLFVFRRSKADSRGVPLYDSYHRNPRGGELTVTVARSFEDLMRVVAMRSSVYLSEQECPYEEEFDGNDLAATHLLGYVGEEPAGCLRIRYFADFAKIERLAVRKEFRHTRLAFQLVRAGIELCQVKGYRKLYGHAQKRLVNFWSRFGFRVLEGGQELVFSDFDYVEMVADIDHHPEAINIGADPYVIIRPEGRWHEPGVLEQSTGRLVSRPSVTRESL